MSQRVPCSIGKTHGEIWQAFQAAYSGDYSERELRRIHHYWINAGVNAGFVRKNEQSRKDAPSPSGGRES